MYHDWVIKGAGGLVENLCPQSVPTPELANATKLLKRFGVPDGI